MIQFSFPLKPCSVNRWKIPKSMGGGRVSMCLSKEYRQFQNDLDIYFNMPKNADLLNGFCEVVEENDRLHLEIIVYGPDFYTKKGKISKTGGDSSNFIKAIEDGLFNALKCYSNLNDAQCFTSIGRKEKADKWRIEINLDLENAEG